MKIVAFPYHDWRKGEIEGIRWRDGHILELLGTHPAVEQLLVIDRPVSRAQRLVRRERGWVQGDVIETRRQGGALARLTNVGSKTAVLDIAVRDLVGPIQRRHAWWFDIFENHDVVDLVAWASDRLLGPRPMAMAWMPTVAEPVRRLDPSRFLFDSLDNWLLHPQLRRYAPLATRGYKELLERADAVVVSAPRSREALAQWSPCIEVIPNGVSPEMFSAPTSRPGDMPPGPVVGYAGSIGPRVDAELVVDVAQRLPTVNFVFVGQTLDRATHRALRSVPNVALLGDRHYSLVPAYLAHFDVAWIPHAVGRGESGGDPIKMYEYWAAGREVVATRIDGLDSWDTRLHLVDSSSEAASVIAGLLEGHRTRKRATVPIDRTWEAITDRLLTLLSG